MDPPRASWFDTLGFAGLDKTPRRRVLVIAFSLVESVLRRTFAASVGNVAVLLALVTLVVLGVAFWQIALAGLLVAVGVILIFQRLRELRS